MSCLNCFRLGMSMRYGDRLGSDCPRQMLVVPGPPPLWPRGARHRSMWALTWPLYGRQWPWSSCHSHTAIMGCDCPTDPEGVADTDGPFREPFTLAQEPDTIAMFSRANSRSSRFSRLNDCSCDKEGGLKLAGAVKQLHC